MLASKPRTAVLTPFAAPSNTTQAKTALFRGFLKSAAGEIYNNLKQLLDLQHPGGNKDAFMKDTLSPLIAPGMETYLALKVDIIDKITSI